MFHVFAGQSERIFKNITVVKDLQMITDWLGKMQGKRRQISKFNKFVILKGEWKKESFLKCNKLLKDYWVGLYWNRKQEQIGEITIWLNKRSNE